MSFFDAVLAGANDRLDYDPYHKPADPVKSWSATFLAAPRKTVSMELSKIWQTGWKNGEVDASVPAEKTSTKMKINHGDCVTTWCYAIDKFSGEGNGILYNADGYKSTVKAALESKPAKGEWKVSGEATLKTPDLGGAKLGVNAGFEHKLDGSSTVVKPKVNVELQEEINVGVSAEHDTKDLKKGLFHCVYSPAGSGNFWIRANMVENLFSAGCDNKLNDSTRHSWEAVYMTADKAEGIQGHPVQLRGGVSYDLSEQTSVEAAASWDTGVAVNQTVTHECDKHWRVSATQSFDSELIGSKQGAYNISFGVTYKL